jgi:hypothetical protein
MAWGGADDGQERSAHAGDVGRGEGMGFEGPPEGAADVAVADIAVGCPPGE